MTKHERAILTSYGQILGGVQRARDINAQISASENFIALNENCPADVNEAREEISDMTHELTRLAANTAGARTQINQIFADLVKKLAALNCDIDTAINNVMNALMTANAANDQEIGKQMQIITRKTRSRNIAQYQMIEMLRNMREMMNAQNQK